MDAIITAAAGIAVALVGVLATYLSRKSATATVLEQLQILEKLPKGSAAYKNLDALIEYRMVEWRSRVGVHRESRPWAVFCIILGWAGLLVSLAFEIHDAWVGISISALFTLGFFLYVKFLWDDAEAFKRARKITSEPESTSPQVEVKSGEQP